MFKKKRKQEYEKRTGIPELPELPKLPEFPGEENIPTVHQLPSFPNNSLGDKFSQNTIKEAVSGRKEDFGEYADEFESPIEMEMMQKPQRTKEIENDYPSRWNSAENLDIPEIPSIENIREPDIMPSKQMEEENKIISPMSKQSKVEPERGPKQIFVRLDKFEESQELLESIKKQISDINKFLDKTKEIKKEEDEELKEWEEELQEIKSNIEKIDKDLFSKL